MWAPGTEASVKTLAELQHEYLTTVGRNTNYLLNISPNTNGNIDAVDHEAYRGLGAWIGATFGEANLVGKAGPVALGSNESVVLNYLARAPRYVALLEDQAAGQHIWGWELHAHPRGGVGWTLLARGESIGHKCSQVLASKSTVSPCKCSQVLLTTIRGFSPPCYENLRW